MSWLVFALCGPILWAISTHLDKYLVERYFKDADVIVLLIFTALMGLVLMPIIAWFEPGVFQRDADSIGLMALSGLLYMAGITFYLRALQGHEASMVAPFFQSSPLFGSSLAYLVLGETLTRTAAPRRRADRRSACCRFRSAGAEARALPLAARRADALRGLRAVAVDADLQGVRRSRTNSGPRRSGCSRARRCSAWAFCASAAIAGSSSICSASNGRALIALNASNELINLGGGLANRYALIFAPLAIVQALGSTTTLFVFVIGVLLTLAVPQVSRENLSAREFAQKGIAAVLVAIGVALVSR